MSSELTARGSRPRTTPSGRPRHHALVDSTLAAWEAVPEPRRSELVRALPPSLAQSLLRLVDPCGLHGHTDAVALARSFRALDPDLVDQLGRLLPLPLFWAVARLAQNLR